MIAINQHIKYLLRHHDCVVLPSLGAFIVRYQAANLEAAGTQFVPPVRSLSFNAAIVDDDGLLAWSVSRHEGISYRDAVAEVTAAIDSMSNMLDVCGYIYIDRVGRLTRSPGSELEFIPDETNAIVNAALSPLPVLSVKPIVEEEEAPAIFEVDFSTHTSLGRRLWRATRYAASVAVLVGLGIAFSTPIAVEHEPAQASLALPRVTKPKAAVVAEPVLAKADAKVDTAITAIAEEPKLVLVKDLQEDNPEARYECFVIVASFTTRSDAERYILQAKASDTMRVLEADGRYRVYVAAGNDYDYAFDYKSTDPAITAAHPTAWVFQK